MALSHHVCHRCRECSVESLWDLCAPYSRAMGYSCMPVHVKEVRDERAIVNVSAEKSGFERLVSQLRIRRGFIVCRAGSPIAD